MAKSRRAGAPWSVPLGALAMLLAPAAQAEWKFTPAVALTETYSDNVNLAPAGQEKGQFVSDLSPSFSIVNNTPRLTLSASYALHAYLYSDKDIPNTNQSSRQAQAALRAKLIEDFLFLDAGATRSQQAVSAFGPQINNNGYAGANRAEVSTWRVSPSLRHQFGASADLSARYTHDSVDAGDSGLANSKGDSVNLNLASGTRFRSLGWALDLNSERIDDSLASRARSDIALLSLRYRLVDTFSLTATGGYDRYTYATPGGETRGKNWSAGFAWTPSQRSSLQASAGKRYFGNTYSLLANHRSRHTVWSINYNDSVTTTRAQFLLPSTVDTASMLDGLFKPRIEDPAARAQAVAAYIASAGLPASLDNSVNYFSNRFMLQKQLMASVAMNGAHSNVVLSAYSSRRNALSTAQADSALFGSQQSLLNENTRQTGVNAIYTLQMSSRSAVNAALTAARTSSLGATALTDNNRALRLGMTHQFGRKVHATAELRHTRGSASFVSGAGYRENAVSATLSTQL